MCSGLVSRVLRLESDDDCLLCCLLNKSSVSCKGDKPHREVIRSNNFTIESLNVIIGWHPMESISTILVIFTNLQWAKTRDAFFRLKNWGHATWQRSCRLQVDFSTFESNIPVSRFMFRWDSSLNIGNFYIYVAVSNKLRPGAHLNEIFKRYNGRAPP